MSEQPDWLDMADAPKDGTEIVMLIRHRNYQYAKPADRYMWESVVIAKWIEFNGGGWTWLGMYGEPVGFRMRSAAAPGSAAEQSGKQE